MDDPAIKSHDEDTYKPKSIYQASPKHKDESSPSHLKNRGSEPIEEELKQ